MICVKLIIISFNAQVRKRERENNTKNTEGDAIIFQLSATLFTDYCILQKAASLIICSHYYYIYIYIHIYICMYILLSLPLNGSYSKHYLLVVLYHTDLVIGFLNGKKIASACVYHALNTVYSVFSLHWVVYTILYATQKLLYTTQCIM